MTNDKWLEEARRFSVALGVPLAAVVDWNGIPWYAVNEEYEDISVYCGRGRSGELYLDVGLVRGKCAYRQWVEWQEGLGCAHSHTIESLPQAARRRFLRALVCLGIDTSEAQEKLGVRVSAHEMLEWMKEFEEKLQCN